MCKDKPLDVDAIKKSAQECIDRWNRKEENGYDPDDDFFGIEMVDSFSVSKTIVGLCELIEKQKLELQK